MSTLRVNTLQDATGSDQPAMVGAAKAWVNFNGIGTVAIRGSFNVSSITDVGTGNYTVNFTTAMPDANYSATATAASGGAGKFAFGYSASAPTASAFSLQTTAFNGTNEDQTYVGVSIFR